MKAWGAILVGAGVLVAAGPSMAGELVASGARSAGPDTSAAVRAADVARADALVEEYLASGVALPARGMGAALPFQSYPQGGNLYRDIHHYRYVDVAPEPDIAIAYDCSPATSEGFAGHETRLRSFAEQDIGVPVYAVADGVVAALYEDGEDRNENNQIGDANFVVIDHGGGLMTRYWHLKRGSVYVQTGQSVEAGQQIALTGSSGVLTPEGTPRLYFETLIDGEPVELLRGACNSDAALGWESPWLNDLKPVIVDQGFVRGDLGFLPWAGHPHPYPRSNHASFEDQEITFWVQGLNNYELTRYAFRFYAPDGELIFESAQGADTFAPPGRWYAGYWVWNIPEMRERAGEWTVQLLYFDWPVTEFTVRVFETAQDEAAVNRPPAPVTAVLEPSPVDPGRAVWARISPDLVNDDPDYDLVRYTYRWLVNGAPVRTITTAGHADAIPASLHGPGDVVTCEVTADDGVRGACPADLNGDSLVDGVDLAVLLAAWGGADGDLSGDGITNTFDLAALLAGWGGCG